MKQITTRDLKESITLLLSQRYDDEEGGWREEWEKGPHLWGALCPLTGNKESSKEDTAYYQIVIRAEINLPSKTAFLWHLHPQSKHLSVVSTPVLIQNNQFLFMTAREEENA